MADLGGNTTQDSLRLGLNEKLALTYDNEAIIDGVGAQLQRIYGTYSISRHLGASYFHSGLNYVGYQGLSALERNVLDPQFHLAFNDLFAIKSDPIFSRGFHHRWLSNISTDDVDELVDCFDRGETGGMPLLVHLKVPYGIADQAPDCYEACKEISPFGAPPRGHRPLRVVLHVRRGELFAVDSDRMLPNSYYIEVAKRVARQLDQLRIDHQMELCTEVPRREFVIEPDRLGVAGRVSAPTSIGSEMSRLDEFGVLPNLTHHVNESAMDCIRRMATADVLVMSRSSFSYLAGILNREGIVFYHPFWHQPLSSWITATSEGAFDESGLMKALSAS